MESGNARIASTIKVRRERRHNAKDADRDGYTNVEEYLNGTDPTAFVDYTKSENNVNTLKRSREK